MYILVYDNSFEGLLSAIFEVYEYKFNPVKIYRKDKTLPFLFTHIKDVYTSEEKAERVYRRIYKLLGQEGMQRIIYAFLSEDDECEDHILRTIQYALATNSKYILNDFHHPSILKLMQYQKSVGRERHRMKAFVRFRLLADDSYFAEVEPDFNVLPLIVKHFRDRYKDQKWIIFDKRRKYGIYYDLAKVEFVEFDFSNETAAKFTNTETDYQQLWQSYFSSTNIKARKNTRLHHQHVPKRYWKYLTEKQVI